MTRPKTAGELESLIGRQAGSRAEEMTISIGALPGQRPNWTCIVKYRDPRHGMGPDDEFVRAVAALQRRFHLHE